MIKGFLLLFVSIMSASSALGSELITLTKDNTIVLDQPVDEMSTGKTLQQAIDMDAKLPSGDPIILVLNTPGGLIEEGLMLKAGLKGLNRPVKTLTLFAASMGFQLVQGLGERLIVPNGTLMAHKARGGFRGEFPGQIDSRYAYYLRRLEKLDEEVVARTKGKYTLETFRNLYENEYWVEGADAVEHGFADKLVTARCDQSLSGTKHTDIDFFGFLIRVVQSQCPINQGLIDIVAMIVTDKGIMSLTEFQAKGGSLQATTRSNPTPFWGGVSDYGPNVESIPGVPVATTQGITIEQINKAIDDTRAKFKRSKNVVVKE